ncbi:MAG: glycosyltransferase family 87 protein [Aureliella sp.]|jgi:hypothetical protein
MSHWKTSVVWAALVVGIALALAGSAARSIRSYDAPMVAEFDRARAGQFDFHNGIYFPALAFVEGVSPYGERFADLYPVTRPLPLMSPLVLVLHAPLAAMPVRAAEIVYFAINSLLMAALAWMCVAWLPPGTRRTLWWLASLLLIVASRSGHTTLFTGYLTTEMVCGTLLALACAARRPWLSAVGVALTSCKPTYAIPLFLLMIARGDHRAAWRGLGLSIVGAGLGAGRLLLAATPAQLWADIQHGQAAHMSDSYELPVNTWTRIDLLAVIAKWLEWAPSEAIHLVVMVLLLPLPALALWQLKRARADERAAGLSSSLIAVSIVATLYHHVYDALLVFPAIFGLWLSEPSTQRGSRNLRVVIAGLLLFVTWNYAGSDLAVRVTGVSGLPLKLLTSTGPIALAAAWLALCGLPFLNKARPADRVSD